MNFQQILGRQKADERLVIEKSRGERNSPENKGIKAEAQEGWQVGDAGELKLLLKILVPDSLRLRS